MIPEIFNTVTKCTRANAKVLQEYKDETQTFYRDGKLTWINLFRQDYNHRSIILTRDLNYVFSCGYYSYCITNSRKGYVAKIPKNYYIDNIHDMRHRQDLADV